MRFRSKPTGGLTVSAVCGTHAVSFAIDPGASVIKGLLGFAVERVDPIENERYFMPNMKVFEDVVKNPVPTGKYSSQDFPIQSFVWDDFTVKPGRSYTYYFYPVTGKPKNLERGKPVAITIQTEPLYDAKSGHAVFFNRGAASSQAYAKEFGNESPDKMTDPSKQAAALAWLGRGLDVALLQFIADAKKGDSLRCAFYEFHYAPVLNALKNAIDRGVDVKIVFDAKDNGKGSAAAFPKGVNLQAIKAAKLPKSAVIARTANPNAIAHNKFMVLLKGGKLPTAVWTGSTNISEGGIYGQTNVGHQVANEEVAARYLAYWNLLSKDPGGDLAANKDYRKQVTTLTPDIDEKKIAEGTTPLFSPRTGLGALNAYVDLTANADRNACITLAFGVNQLFKDELDKHTQSGPLVFMMLEQEDKPNPRAKNEFVALTWKNNVYEAFGSYIKNPVYDFVRETTTKIMGLNDHVAYIHSKFLLHDPLSDDPIVVTGSANFSNASTTTNDENMIVVRGDKRVADIYFTEFNRLFNHYYFRSVYNTVTADKGKVSSENNATVFLDPTDGWQKAYKKGSLRRKRIDLFASMSVGKTARAVASPQRRGVR